MPKVGIPGDEQQAEANQRVQDSAKLDNEQKRLQRQEEDLVKEVLIEREAENLNSTIDSFYYLLLF